MLYKRGDVVGEAIDCTGSNMLNGGENDGEYWIDLPDDDWNGLVKNGDIESVELYVHVKPALGGTFTDIVDVGFLPLQWASNHQVWHGKYSTQQGWATC
ncbi:hypothetical protein IFM89_017697 [Coptis chinensis]|uniref:Uncharacterized protein n=1 Tax=Coptis chinensis TaxID=261450 RepID=A0A835I3T6_9MAGN|nr:hypothetical protein IFM89_017697 [Coptis chinensis]